MYARVAGSPMPASLSKKRVLCWTFFFARVRCSHLLPLLHATAVCARVARSPMPASLNKKREFCWTFFSLASAVLTLSTSLDGSRMPVSLKSNVATVHKKLQDWDSNSRPGIWTEWLANTTTSWCWYICGATFLNWLSTSVFLCMGSKICTCSLKSDQQFVEPKLQSIPLWDLASW